MPFILSSSGFLPLAWSKVNQTRYLLIILGNSLKVYEVNNIDNIYLGCNFSINIVVPTKYKKTILMHIICDK